MKKMVLLLVALSVLAVLVILAPATLLWAPGYQEDPPAGPQATQKGGKEPPSKISVEVASIEYEAWVNDGVFSEGVPQKIQEIITDLKEGRGYFAFDPQEYSGGKDPFILISSGEKRSGGYWLELNNIAAKNNTLKVIVEEKGPTQEKAVIQVLTYPLLLLKVKGNYDQFDISNTAGETFPPIRPLPH